MSLPSDYAVILNELNRDVSRHRPRDPLQFCSDWFASKLREERFLASSSAGGGGLGTSAAAAAAAAGRSTSAINPFGGEDTTMTSVPPSAATAGFQNANPFATSATSGPGADVGPSAGAARTDDPSGLPAFAPPPNFNFNRRTSVSAESLAPVSSPASTPSANEALSKTVIPKSDSQMQRIRQSIQSNLLFRNLDEEQERDVLLAMKEVTCEAGTIVIHQGDQGDFFYVVESGTLDVYIKAAGAPGTNDGLPGGIAGRGSVGSIYSTDSDGPASTQFGSSVVLGTNLSATLGERKVSYGPSDAFGELALLYLQPRAASIVATSRCVLWALDRVTFRSILMETNSRKRGQLEKFLRNVHLFDSLDTLTLAKLADALQFRDYQYGERIIEQGERGTEFFLIIDGTVGVRKRREASSADEDDCGTLITGEYFGELALLNNAPRAASIVALPAAADAARSSSGKVKVAVLSEQAFKRLVGSLASTMELHASTHYFGGAGPGAVGGGAAVDTSAGSLAALANGFGTAAAAGAAGDDVGPGPHDVEDSAQLDPRAGGGIGMGRWVGGMGSSPFAPGLAPAPPLDVPPRG